MKESASNRVLGAAKALNAALRELKRPYLVIGGIAVIARGAARFTADVDATVWAEGLAFEDLVDVLSRHGIHGRIPDLFDFARENQVLLLVHKSTRTEVDVSLGWLPFEREAMRRATHVSFGRARIPTATAEDLIVLKALAWRDKDRIDIEHLAGLYGRRLDLRYILRHVTQLAELADLPERSRELEMLIRRTAGGPLRSRKPARKRRHKKT